MNDKKLFRVSNQNNFLGVLQGFANYFSVDVTMLRIVFVLLVLVTGFFTLVIGYFIAALFMPTA